MTEKTHEKDLDALKADIARLREEIAAFVTDAKAFAEKKYADSRTGGDRETGKEKSSANGEHGHEAWTDFQRTLDEAWTRGEKIVKDLAAEIERHPLVSIMAAFGLGFIISKLWHRGSK